MFDPKKTGDGIRLSDRATLLMLTTLEKGDALSQRGLATRIGVARGMTNNLLKSSTRKGLPTVKHALANRYATPKDMRKKSRLVAEYLSTGLVLVRQAREEYSAIYGQVKGHNHKRIALYGAAPLLHVEHNEKGGGA